MTSVASPALASPPSAVGGPATNSPEADGSIRIVSGSGFRYVTPFPWTLHQLLTEVGDSSPDSEVVSWLDDGRCFRVHDTQRFIDDVAPRYFKHKSYKSFQRQLYLYGFQRISAGEFQGAYFHPKFIESDRNLTHQIGRTKAPVSKPRRSKVAKKKAAKSRATPPRAAKKVESSPQYQDDKLPPALVPSATKPSLPIVADQNLSSDLAGSGVIPSVVPSSFASSYKGDNHFDCAVPNDSTSSPALVFEGRHSVSPPPGVSSFIDPVPRTTYSGPALDKTDEVDQQAILSQMALKLPFTASELAAKEAAHPGCVSEYGGSAPTAPVLPPPGGSPSGGIAASLDGEPLEANDLPNASSLPLEVGIPSSLTVPFSDDEIEKEIFSTLCEKINSGSESDFLFQDEDMIPFDCMSEVSGMSFIDDTLL